MKKSVIAEIKQIIKELDLNCSIREFENRVSWYNISDHQKLSEDFIREFKNRVCWIDISKYQKLSEDFIREFKNKVCWIIISCYQKLSEDFIREFKDKVDWNYISSYQQLSEEFIREFKDKVNCNNISAYQKLSEEFIKEFKDDVNWYYISICQKLSKKFIREFKGEIDKEIQNLNHKNKTKEQKLREIKEYAEKYNLKFDGNYLYAFRNHDKWGRGVFNKTIFYEKGSYYQDWHCNMNPNDENSFGLGIWPEGNTAVKVKVEDWGVEVDRDDEDGKARVWGFEVI